ncbi:metal ABC transporter permease [Avibacterium paragallinarum]|uniref:Putative ABC-type chelated iron transport system, permease component n=1 Tax=Avibacterium paragallinarum TaxID=728 RepID=A0A377I7W8_AVIPA|nr:metal ABC transporter permease [Avibacterium paragallinarum]POY46758.1 metal ABC transporter permease [Avibacterium paragallinarum]RZN77280.1 metal ABC transporter permease [Avibacterium paragallinarum]CDF99728.1 Putative Iron (Fe3+) ABC superfamily ATP binding cassette transporter, membrane protein YfeC [Avibacterium paragallinarum JF4211]STO71405.1 putative ABC-type chelated iron transport system, permease component [Avibacterium paragallinarum]
MLSLLLEPFNYNYMIKAFLLSALIGGLCAFLSAYLMLKGWSLIGDALSHSVVPGVAIAYAFSFPYAIGAFLSGILAALAILWVKALSNLRQDAVIGFIFTTFFALGLFIISLNPTSINVNEIILGNILGISDEDLLQIIIMIIFCFLLLFLFWKDLLLVFFDEIQATAVGLSPFYYKLLFFTLLSASIVAALQTVGAILVIAMVITPGATAFLLTDKFKTLVIIAVILGILTNLFGVYFSYFLDCSTGGIIICFQTILFLLSFLFSPKYGLLRKKYSPYKEIKND